MTAVNVDTNDPYTRTNPYVQTHHLGSSSATDYEQTTLDAFTAPRDDLKLHDNYFSSLDDNVETTNPKHVTSLATDQQQFIPSPAIYSDDAHFRPHMVSHAGNSNIKATEVESQYYR